MTNVSQESSPRAPAPLRFFDVVSHTDRPRRAKRARRTSLVAGGHVRSYNASDNEALLPLLADRTSARVIGASRRSVLKGMLTVASGAAASLTASLGPGRALAAQEYPVPEGGSPYRIISGCGGSFEENNCLPGCQGPPICNSLGCCSPEGWFRNDPAEGFMPLGFESQSCFVIYTDGTGGLVGDGWLWEYRPDLDGVDANGPCSHCKVLVTRCHDGRYFDEASGTWLPGICRSELSCEPSGRPRLPEADETLALPQPFPPLEVQGALEAAVDQGDGQVVVWGWAHANDTTPIEVVVSVDEAFTWVTTASLARRDVAFRDGSGCCHGFTASIGPLEAGKHTVCLFGRRGPQQQRIACTEVTVADYTREEQTETTPSPAIPGPVALSASDRLAIGAIELLIPGPYGGAYASGWALDPDTDLPVALVASVDGTDVATTLANLSRSDVAAVAPEVAHNSGWTLVIPFPAIDEANPPDRISNAQNVRHEVCISVIDATDGRRRLLGCQTVASTETWSDYYPTSAIDAEAAAADAVEIESTPIAGSPQSVQGAVEAADTAGDGTVVVRGWCYGGPDATDVEVVANNLSVITVRADQQRDDLASMFDTEGRHGFAVPVSGLAGPVTVEVYALGDEGERIGLLGMNRVFVE